MNPNNKKPLGERAHYIWQAARPEIKEFVGMVIRETRLRRNVDVPAMAEALGVSPTAIYRWERGDIGGTPAMILYWLFMDHDGVESMDPLYWRARAIMAEDTLSRIQESMHDHNEQRKEFMGEDDRHKVNGTRKLVPRDYQRPPFRR